MKAFNISFLFLKSNKNFCGLEKKAIPERIKPDTANLTIVKKGVERLVLENKSCPHIPEIAHNTEHTIIISVPIYSSYTNSICNPQKGENAIFLSNKYTLYFIFRQCYRIQLSALALSFSHFKSIFFCISDSISLNSGFSKCLVLPIAPKKSATGIFSFFNSGL